MPLYVASGKACLLSTVCLKKLVGLLRTKLITPDLPVRTFVLSMIK